MEISIGSSLLASNDCFRKVQAAFIFGSIIINVIKEAFVFA